MPWRHLSVQRLVLYQHLRRADGGLTMTPTLGESECEGPLEVWTSAMAA